VVVYVLEVRKLTILSIYSARTANLFLDEMAEDDIDDDYYSSSSEEEEQDFLQTSEKEHNIPTPGVSELTSTVEFERKCSKVFHKHPYKTLAPSEFVAHVCEKMGISQSRAEALKELCK